MDEVEARQAPTCGARAAWPARHCHPPPRPYHPQIPRRTLAASLLQPILAVWSLSALATSLASLFLLRRHPAALERPRVREPWYAALRVHRALAIVGMRRVLKDPVKLGRCARARSATSAISVHQCVMVILYPVWTRGARWKGGWGPCMAVDSHCSLRPRASHDYSHPSST